MKKETAVFITLFICAIVLLFMFFYEYGVTTENGQNKEKSEQYYEGETIWYNFGHIDCLIETKIQFKGIPTNKTEIYNFLNESEELEINYRTWNDRTEPFHFLQFIHGGWVNETDSYRFVISDNGICDGFLNISFIYFSLSEDDFPADIEKSEKIVDAVVNEFVALTGKNPEPYGFKAEAQEPEG